MSQPNEPMERTGRIEDLDRSFDIEYWQRQGPAAIFEAAWEMVVEHFVRTTGKVPQNSDLTGLLRIFNEIGVKYLVIGGHAVMYYTEPRYTKDLDLWIEASVENGRKVFSALAQFGAPLKGLSAKDFSEEGSFYQMGRPPVRIDILMSVTGLDFESAWKNRVAADFQGEPIHLISRADLIALKKASGRHIDLHDVELLESENHDFE